MSEPPSDWILDQAANLSAAKDRNSIGALAWNLSVAFRRWADVQALNAQAATPAHAELSPGNSSDLRGEKG